jgi:hypothetical protein
MKEPNEGDKVPAFKELAVQRGKIAGHAAYVLAAI